MSSPICYVTIQYHGKFPGDISCSEKAIIVNGQEILITNETSNLTNLPWKDLSIDIVMESTGKFRRRDEAVSHLTAGAKKVIIAAPGKGVDATFVMGGKRRHLRSGAASHRL